MATFPRLSTNAVTQYPSGRQLEASTSVTTFIDGSEQRFRNLSAPVKRWVLNLHDVAEKELQAIEAFWSTQQGPVESFAFVDPWDGVEYPDCSFETQFIELNLRDDGRCSSNVVIRNNQV